MSTGTDPARLVALAGELEKEGQYNIAKLLRAAAASSINAAAFSATAPRDRHDQAHLLREIAASLENENPALVPALRASADRLEAGEVPLIGDAPDPYVCRICGTTELGPFDSRCPTCGRWPDTTERMRPIYWMRASSPPEALELMRRTPRSIEIILQRAEPDALVRPGPDGGWSAHETLAHLHNAQGILRHRLGQFLTADHPTLESVMVWEMEADPGSTAELFASYLALRADVLATIDGIPTRDLWKTGLHEEWGRVTLAEQLSYFANHEPTHLGQLADAAG